MFDCVEKKSLLKENINYEYNIQTTQDINNNEGDSGQAYELESFGNALNLVLNVMNHFNVLNVLIIINLLKMN